MKIVDMTEEQRDKIQMALEDFDNKYVTYRMEGQITIGLENNGEIVGGLLAYMSVYRILYVDTVFVKEEYRRKGYGKLLVEEMEKKAKQMGANTIRLDTFNWQGKEFYIAMNYEQVGFYKNSEDNYEEYFFLKRL